MKEMLLSGCGTRVANDASPGQQGGGIGQFPARAHWTFPDIAHQHSDLARLRGKASERGKIGFDEGRPQEQVPRRISGERQFREQNQVHTCGHALPVGGQNPRLVAGNIPNRRIELREGQSHAALN